ncbi:MAG: FecR domain-containing protein [Luteolibacter sp.]
MKGRELEVAIQEMLDGTLEEVRARELQEVLRNDPQARGLYLSYAGLQQALEFRLAKPQPGPDHRLVTAWRLKRERRRTWRIAAIAAGIVIVAQVFVFRSIVGSGRASSATVKLSPYTLSSLRDPTGAVQAGGRMEPGSRLSLSQGNAELTFANGTKALVQGPAELTLVKKGELNLERGVIWCLVAPKDRGFRVMTPELEVMDLGTDFGVVSDPDARDEVHVFSGTVEVRNRKQPTDQATLHGGEARTIGASDRFVSIPSRPDHFPRVLPDSLPMIRFDFASIQGGSVKVMGDHPEIADISAWLAPGEASPQVEPGHEGSALRFLGHHDRVQTNWPGIAGNAPRTVTFWLKVDPSANLSRLPAILGWGNPKVPNGKWKILLAQERPGMPAYPRISFGWHGYDSSVAVNDGRWHHCAMTYTGRMKPDQHPDVSIHVDGISTDIRYQDFQSPGSRSREPETATGANGQPLAIGYFQEEEASRSFNGWIEDVRIYAGVLPEEAIMSQSRGDSQAR